MTEVMLRDRWKKEKNMNRVNVISTDTIKKVGHKKIKLCQTYLLNKWLSILVLLYALKSSGMSNTGMLTCCNSCNCVGQGVGSLPSPGDTGFFSTIPMPMQYCQILHNYNTIQYIAICLNIAYNAPQYR